MDLFEKRLESLKEIITKPKQEYTFESQKVLLGSNQEGTYCVAQSTSTHIVVQANTSNIQQLFGTHKFSNAEPYIGAHPDFKYLKNGESENHYAVSMFVDIKGSTKLVKRYDLQTIKVIKETILSLVIEVCSFFGGHIQRLQGDGAFVYFVRKEMNEKDAIINSLNASSLLAYLIENKITPFFNNEGVESPEIRIGIDYGNAEETLWSYYGVRNCKELTTTGLHTDLAAKLQAEAEGNGIMIGENIVKELDLQENFLQVKFSNPEIFDDYKMFQFNWDEYLLTFNHFSQYSNRVIGYLAPEFSLKCEIAKAGSDDYFEYYQNLYSIPKGYKIKFTLLKNGIVYNRNVKLKEEIRWEIINGGNQARTAKALKIRADESNNSSICSATAEFLGHQYMNCKIIRNWSNNINIKFFLFIQ